MTSPSSWAAIQDQPVRPPPPGVVPNLAHPESRAFEIHVAASVSIPLILLFAAMRFYAKLAILKRWAWDDGKGLNYSRITLLAESSDSDVYLCRGNEPIMYASSTSSHLRSLQDSSTTL